MTTKLAGDFSARNDFRTHGHGVVSTRRAASVAAVSARDIRNAALRTPWLVISNPPHAKRGVPGVHTSAGAAIRPVNHSTRVQIQVASFGTLNRESNAIA